MVGLGSVTSRQLITPTVGKLRNDRQTQDRSLCSALCHLATLDGTASEILTLKKSTHAQFSGAGTGIENAERTGTLGTAARRWSRTTLTGSTLACHSGTARYGNAAIPQAKGGGGRKRVGGVGAKLWARREQETARTRHTGVYLQWEGEAADRRRSGRCCIVVHNSDGSSWS